MTLLSPSPPNHVPASPMILETLHFSSHIHIVGCWHFLLTTPILCLLGPNPLELSCPTLMELWLRLPVLGLLKSIFALVVVLDGLLYLILCVHNKRSVLHYGLIQWLPTEKKKPQRLRRPVPHAETVSKAQHQCMVACHRGRIRVPEDAFTIDDVDKGIPRLGDALVDLRSRFQHEIQIHCRSSGAYRWSDSKCFPGDNSDIDSIFLDPDYVIALQLLVSRFDSLDWESKVISANSERVYSRSRNRLIWFWGSYITFYLWKRGWSKVAVHGWLPHQQASLNEWSLYQQSSTEEEEASTW